MCLGVVFLSIVFLCVPSMHFGTTCTFTLYLLVAAAVDRPTTTRAPSLTTTPCVSPSGPAPIYPCASVVSSTALFDAAVCDIVNRWWIHDGNCCRLLHCLARWPLACLHATTVVQAAAKIRSGNSSNLFLLRERRCLSCGCGSLMYFQASVDIFEIIFFHNWLYYHDT